MIIKSTLALCGGIFTSRVMLLVISSYLNFDSVFDQPHTAKVDRHISLLTEIFKEILEINGEIAD